MKPFVFLGPSLSLTEARDLLDAVYLPPVSQGDVASLVAKEQPEVIGIIDGFFQTVPTVWHKEILLALSKGVQVVGGASMGALRAAELHPFGMLGVGRIFRWYRDGVIDADDEVTVYHGPAEIGYPPISEALVNMRATFQEAVRQNLISLKTERRLIAATREMYYGDRSYEALLAGATSLGIPKRELAVLESFVCSHRIDQKKRDAIEALRTIRDISAAPAPKVPQFELHETIFLNDLLDRDQLATVGPDRRITNEQIVNHTRLAHPHFARLRSELVDENIILRYARVIGVRIEHAELQRGLDAFRRERGLLRKVEMLEWLDTNRLTLERLSELIERQLLIGKTRELCSRVDHRTTLDRLRIDGLYPAAEAAAIESGCIPGCGSLVGQDELHERELVELYCTHRGREIPRDIDSLAAELGFADRTTLIVELKKYRDLNTRPSQARTADAQSARTRSSRPSESPRRAAAVAD